MAATGIRFAKEPSRLTRAVTRLWMKSANVTANERLADRFHLITLEGDPLAGVTWRAGQKVQIAMGSAFATRTYTPIEWNSSAGRTCILGYAHGDGPGSAWVRNVAPGDACDIFGPRASLEISDIPGPVLIIGDETSIGLAYAATHQQPDRLVKSCFEVDGDGGAQRVVERLNFQDVSLIERRVDNAHIATLKKIMSDSASVEATFVLTGKATTIQTLRNTLRQWSVPKTRLVTKAYWAPGKTGLD